MAYGLHAVERTRRRRREPAAAMATASRRRGLVETPSPRPTSTRRLLDAGAHPPIPPKLFVKVPMRMSTSAGSTPQCSQHPFPVSPNAPIECASSKYRYALYFFATFEMFFRSQISPSML